ncbi:hypothetical protein R3W88_017513 [Solanum pinnatisectum]|uniref:Uncharacterized protein n=1 Tax=Solanum pinnatisectum TaxID=50273 RepID=A0AAV9L2T7_9SOLN|nr:hypothetical protein R3W88_017513 [Solanum pinnatisectum]
MGALIVGEQVPMSVMLLEVMGLALDYDLEVMGLALDYDFVDFGFNWTVQAWFDGTWNRIASFGLRTGNYFVIQVQMNEEKLALGAMVMDIEGYYMPID